MGGARAPRARRVRYGRLTSRPARPASRPAAKLAVDAVLRTKTLNLEQIQIIKMAGGSLKVRLPLAPPPPPPPPHAARPTGMMSSRKKNVFFPQPSDYDA